MFIGFVFFPPFFVLRIIGGPGSGKVTHCDTLMEEKRGVTHINMMDLLHQHVISNGIHLYTYNLNVFLLILFFGSNLNMNIL